MKTKIYPTYSDFLNREDRTLNGVSPDFAESHPKWGAENISNEACWNCSDCYGCSRCSRCSGCSDCSRCYGCSRCSRCSDCSRCSRCSDCYGCSRCSGKKGENTLPEIPTIKDIHRTILAAVEKPGALDMGDWHTCETTHCRGGWAVHLAGEKGKELESRTSTIFAAMQIYHKSSPIKVSPVRYFENEERALADMRRCAKEEAALAGGEGGK